MMAELQPGRVAYPEPQKWGQEDYEFQGSLDYVMK